jgi:5-methyltetrahydropteroyltriglutamate--homocysteine methyltransferase
MGLLTTTIGAFPKPDYVKITDWFKLGMDTPDPTKDYAAELRRLGNDAEEIFVRGTREAIEKQIQTGIDIPTDGEIRRENYIHYHCRHLDGIDFDALTERTVRGNYTARLPTIEGPIKYGGPFLTHDFQVARSFSDRPIKMTMPGPMTICDTVADAHYQDPRRAGADIADALNNEVRALARAGCRHIQIDEPVFARKPEAALDFGLEHLERCFFNCPDDVVRTVHICCGYPDRLDNPNYPKAEREAYFQLADAVEASSIDAVSLEDAHRPNELSLLERFKTTTVILGVVAIAKSRVETVDEIASRLSAALNHIDAGRLIAAPDCGLGMLGATLALRKLTNLAAAAQVVA